MKEVKIQGASAVSLQVIHQVCTWWLQGLNKVTYLG